MIPAESDNTPLCDVFDQFRLWYPGGLSALPPFPTKEEDVAEWWQEANRREAETLSAFKELLEAGELKVLVFDPARNMSFAITPTEWRNHHPFAGVLSSIGAEKIKESHSDSLSKYNGLVPYVDSRQFRNWFRSLKSLREGRGRRPVYAWPKFDEKTLAVLDEEGAPGASPDWSQADLENQMTDWCEKTWGHAPAESMIRKRVSLVLKKFIHLRAYN